MSPLDSGKPTPQLELTSRPSESFKLDTAQGKVVRTVRWNGKPHTTSLDLPAGHIDFVDEATAWDWAWLRQSSPPRRGRGERVRIADIFSGCGQMSVGAAEAARAVGLHAELALAVDLAPDAVEVCRRMFPSCDGRTTPIEHILDGTLRAKPTKIERAFIKQLGEIDLLVGGPPCQGHSDFNNHTRRHDDRNALALKMVRFAELVRPRHIVLENVRGIIHDRSGVFQTVRAELERLKYRTAQRLLEAETHGVPQLRRRMFLVATLERDVDPDAALTWSPTKARSFSWACSDLERAAKHSDDPFNRPPKATERNQKRIDYLFQNELWDLPNHQRPPCHQDGGHSYKSVYGRMYWNRPVQTITTGFRCMGQGRFVHPRQPRTITPHEAARLQFIPDFVDFSGLRATSVAKLIGNAVPPKLLYGIGLALFSGQS